MRPGVPPIACLLDCWIKPADTMEPPDGSSTVVVFVRVLKPIWFEQANCAEASPSGSVTSVARCREMRPFRQNRWREIESDAVVLQRRRNGADAGFRVDRTLVGDRDGPAGRKLCGLS